MIRVPKTYSIGLLQAKAYRILKVKTAEVLAPYKLTPFEWSLLGILYESPKGVRASDLAEELGVKRPMISRYIASFEKRGLIQEKASQEDKRAKVIVLTPKAKSTVQKLEPILRKSVGSLVKGASVGSLTGYYTTLKKITKNAPKHAPENDNFESYKP